ncbi:MAG: hypothetical protein CPDRYMAC_1105 [uncultured Paraburkholderia sp.]|nr:MAG: hypothetical protein CPDRYMAC_1105 [uncultured Paraburkholderia sp.]
MSYRQNKNCPFDPVEAGVPEVSTPDWTNPAPASEAAMMRELHLASVSVLSLATRAHDGVARGDSANAEVVHASLEPQLALTTRLIDDMLLQESNSHTTHALTGHVVAKLVRQIQSQF